MTKSKMTPSRCNVGFIASIPNDEEGRRVIKYLRQHFNYKNYGLRTRGRFIDREKCAEDNIPTYRFWRGVHQKYAKELRLYITAKFSNGNEHQMDGMHYEHLYNNRSEHPTMTRILEARVEDAENEASCYRTTNQELRETIEALRDKAQCDEQEIERLQKLVSMQLHERERLVMTEGTIYALPKERTSAEREALKKAIATLLDLL